MTKAAYKRRLRKIRNWHKQVILDDLLPFEGMPNTQENWNAAVEVAVSRAGVFLAAYRGVKNALCRRQRRKMKP